MGYRKLRIAWSVACGIAAVLLVVLWVRSYSARDMIRGVIGNKAVNMISVRGQAAFAVAPWLTNPFPWIFESVSDSQNMVAVFSQVTGKPPLSVLGIRWRFNPALNVVVLPHWLLVAFTTTVAAVPWLPWWSKRFSVRTLLLATTLVAIALGLIVWAAR